MRLYNYFRSSASFRVRIALGLKGLAYDYVPVHLPKSEQLQVAFRAVAQTELVPALVIGEGADALTLTQSLAIIEYLDETHPEPRLLPSDPVGRARVRSLSLDIACEIHPLNNLRVLRYLVNDLGVSEEAKNNWYRHWVETGLAALERQLVDNPATGRFCHGGGPTMADCTLVPQIFNARRVDSRLDHVPTVMRIFDTCMTLPAFAEAEPSACPDAE
ncbi:MAG: maleylacetoacetate isomerase [Caldimonas sp.]